MSGCGCEIHTKTINQEKLLAFQALVDLPLGDCELSQEVRAMEGELLDYMDCGDGYATAFEELCGCANERLEGKGGWCQEAAELVGEMCCEA